MKQPRPKSRPWQVPSAPRDARIATRERTDFYHTNRWKRESSAFAKENPLCTLCLVEGLTVPGEVTDHKIPLQLCKDPWDKSNWQRICKRHHAIKGPQDRKMINDHKNNQLNEK